MPLNPARVREIPWTLVVDRRYTVPATFYTSLGPRLGAPETYRMTVQTTNTSSSALIHESRCIRFGAIPTDPIKSRSLYGWDMPVLQRPYAVLRTFGTAMQSASLMLTDASQGVFKIKNLIGMIAGNEKDALQQRMQMVDMARSTARSILVDADTEGFEKVATSFAGMPELLDRFMQRLSAAAKIPVAILMGRSAAGMNATGDLDLDSWHAQVAAYQKHEVTPRLLKIFAMLSLARSSPMRGVSTQDLDILWEPLAVPSQKEDAEAYKTRQEADCGYVTAGVLDPAQVAIARFGRGEYSTDAPEVDVAALEAELAARPVFDPNAPPPPNTLPPSDPTKALPPASADEPIAPHAQAAE